MNNPVVSFADTISDPDVKDAFLALMAVTLVNGDVEGLARELQVTDDHPVWPHIEAFLNKEYGLSVEALVTKD